jgi:hypothetical protein
MLSYIAIPPHLVQSQQAHAISKRMAAPGAPKKKALAIARQRLSCEA